MCVARLCGAVVRVPCRLSKAALNMGARMLSVDLLPKGIAVGMIHPGFVDTDMAKPLPVRSCAYTGFLWRLHSDCPMPLCTSTHCRLLRRSPR